MRHTNDLPVLIERWFTDRLMKHRGVSPNTIASYRDTFRLLFAFAQTRIGRSPSQLTLRDLDALNRPKVIFEGPCSFGYDHQAARKIACEFNDPACHCTSSGCD